MLKYASPWQSALLSTALLATLVPSPQPTRADPTPSPDPLTQAFLSPPPSAKPHTWWHWMNGNVSKPGITLDLEAMKRVGIGGAHLAQVGTGIPKGPVPYDSPEMLDAVRFACHEADRLNLDLTLFNCPGWSSSGGPWVKPENSMKVLTFTETTIDGGKQITLPLPQPPSKLDFYRDAFTLLSQNPSIACSHPFRKNPTFPSTACIPSSTILSPKDGWKKPKLTGSESNKPRA